MRKTKIIKITIVESIKEKIEVYKEETSNVLEEVKEIDFYDEGIFPVILPEGKTGYVEFCSSKEEDKSFLIRFSKDVKSLHDSILHIIVDRISNDVKMQMITLLKNGNNEFWYKKYFISDIILSKYETDSELSIPLKYLRNEIEGILNIENDLYWGLALWNHLRDIEYILFPEQEYIY